MTKRFKLLTLMASCVIIGACLNALFARDESPSTWKALEKSYAQANLELAQARLAQAKGENAAVAGSVPDGTLAELQAGVQMTRDRLRQLDSNDNTHPYAPQLVAAQDEVNALEADHAESLKANKVEAGAVSDFELRREQAEINVAKARLAALKVLAQQPPEVRVQWEISQLQDEIRALWARPMLEDF
jgi:hypothetical protein